MIYCVLGNDFKKGREYINTILQKENGANVFSYTKDTFSEDVCSEHLSSQNLFEEKQIVILDGVMEDVGYKEFLLENVEDLKESKTTFIIKEEKLLAKPKGVLEKHAEDSVFFEEKKEGKDTFSIFALGDAVGRRDKKKAWLVFQESLEAGASPENIYGTLFWQAKMLCLVLKKEKGEKLSLNPYVLRKTEGFAKNFSVEEGESLLTSLVKTYHDARRGKEELVVGLEKIILSL